MNMLHFMENEMVGSNDGFRGHRTSADPKSIMEKGLFVPGYDINSTTGKMGTSSVQDILRQLEGWSHYNGNYFIVIEIPEEIRKRGLDGDQGIVAFTAEENNFNAGQGGGAIFKIPPKYIRGYIDLTTKEFFPNDGYVFSKDNPNRDQEIAKAKAEIEFGYKYDKDGNSFLMDGSEEKRNDELGEMLESSSNNVVDNTVQYEIPILDKYKELKKDYSKKVEFIIRKDDNTGLFHTILATIDKRTGEQSIVLEDSFEFDGMFSRVILPSLYNALADGFPTDDFEKKFGETEMFKFQCLNRDDVMLIGGLSHREASVVREMRKFVDEQNFGVKLDEIPEKQY